MSTRKSEGRILCFVVLLLLFINSGKASRMKVDEENPNKDESIPLLPDQNDANDNLNEGV